MKAFFRALGPVRLRVRLARAARASGCALFSAAAFTLGLRVAMFFAPVERPAAFLLPVLALTALAVAAVFVWPVSNGRAARAADDCGLRQRALTALELSADSSPMTHLQREDALNALRALDIKRALPVRISRRWLTAMALCAALSGALCFAPNPQSAVIAQKRLTREALEEQAEKIEKAADALPESAEADQLAQLRKLARELAQALKTSESARDALIKLNEAGDAIQRIELQQAQNAVGAASEALGAGGLDELRRALESGDADQLQKAMENLASGADQGALSQALSSAAASAPAGSALQTALQNAAQAAPGSAQSAALNQLAGKLSASSSASTGQLSALVASAKAGLGGVSGGKSASAAGSGAGSGQKGSGSGSGAGKGGQGQGSGAGAGMGTTNKDAGYQAGGARQSGSNAGSGAPVVKTGAYESIYDPTRLGDGGEVSQSTGQVSEGDVSRADLAPGLGTAGGAVPFAQGARSYGQAAANAANRPGVPEAVQKMVNAYFSALIDESEG